MRFLKIIFCLPLIAYSLISYGQSSDYLQKLETYLFKLESNQAELLFPEIFNRLRERVKALKNSYTPFDEPLEDTHTFQELSQEIQSLLLVTEKAQRYMVNVLISRREAVNAGAEEFAPELFLQADEELRSAAQAIRDDKLQNAERIIKDCEKLYQQAELEAIRSNLLGETQILIQESRDLGAEQLAPETYKQTARLLTEVENLVEQNRFEAANLSSKSQELLKQSRHLLNLVQQIKSIHRSPQQIESFLLQLEEQLALAAEELNQSFNLSGNYKEAWSEIHSAIKSMNEENKQLKQRNRELMRQKWELERQLLREKDGTEREKYISAKLENIKSELNLQVDRFESTFIFYTDSLFFDTERESLTPRSIANLERLVTAVNQIPHQSMKIYYVESGSDKSAYAKAMLDRRTKFLERFMESRSALDEEQIAAIGNLQGIDFPAIMNNSYLEITIDAGEYFSNDNQRHFSDEHAFPEQRKSTIE